VSRVLLEYLGSFGVESDWSTILMSDFLFIESTSFLTVLLVSLVLLVASETLLSVTCLIGISLTGPCLRDLPTIGRRCGVYYSFIVGYSLSWVWVSSMSSDEA